MTKLTAEQTRVMRTSTREQIEEMLAFVVRRDAHPNVTQYTLEVKAASVSGQFTTTSLRFYEASGTAPENNIRNERLPRFAEDAADRQHEQDEEEFFHPNDD